MLAFGGSFVGGGLGFKGGAKLDAYPRMNPFNYRPYAEPGTLGSNFGNVRGRYVGPATEGGGLSASPRGPGLETRGYRPQPGERATTREQWRAAESQRRYDARASALDINRQKQDGHIPGTPQYANRAKIGKPTSSFLPSENADALTREAWIRGRPVPGRPGVRDYEFGRPVGTGPGGGTQSRVRVHQAPSTAKIHGHPSGPETPP